MCNHTFTLVDTRKAPRVRAVVMALALAAVVTVPVSVLDTAVAGTDTDNRAAIVVDENVPPASTLNTPWG